MAAVTIGSTAYPAYASVAEADAYLAADVMRAAAWALRNADAKGRGLVSASRMLARLPWSGGAPSIDAPPEVLVEVTAMLAADLLAKPRLFSDASGNSNVRSAKAGSAQVEFFRPVEGGAPIPRDLWLALVAAGLVGTPGSSDPSPNDGPFVGGRGGGCAAPGAGYDHPPYWTDPGNC